MNRRDFLKATAAVMGAMGLTQGLNTSHFAWSAETQWKTKLRKAMISEGMPVEATLKMWKENGFEGTETTAWDAGYEKALEARKMAEKCGMEIHSVMRAWTNFNSKDDAAVKKDIESVELALQSAVGFGATAILLVPCRTDAPAIKPRDFKIEFDPETLMVTKVVEGDNKPYQAYIDIQNYSTKISIECLKKLIPAAEKAGVVIGLENVWNNLWITPDFFAAFVRSFKSPWIRSYLDLGNHIKYAETEKYVYALSDTIVRLHAKDYDFNKGDSFAGFVELRKGTVNWPAVRQALEDVNYNGFITIEGGSDPVAQQSKDLDLIIAGK